MNRKSQTEKDATIVVKDICKDFRVYKDKSHTFKDRVLFHKRNAYELNHVLDHVSFNVYKGEALGLIGHNGCGKSTTLKLLNKILYPDSGSIEMKGRVSSLIELGAGFHPDMTGRENIYINASIFGLKKKEIDARLDDIIRFSELEDFIDNPVRTYSSGMYMRLAFSIAINVDADILLVDEILAVGDANFQKKCFDKLEEIKNNGTTIVIVSHSMDQIKSICDQVIWLEDGKIREQGEAKDVCSDYLRIMEKRADERRLQELKETDGAIKDPMAQYPPEQVSEQVDPLARREGDMTARYTNIRMLDVNGKVCQEFQGKPAFLLDLTLHTDKPCDIDIVINIYNRYGLHCTGIKSHWLDGKYLMIDGDWHRQIMFHELPLIHGEYLIDLTLTDKDGKIRDNLLHFLQFRVLPDPEQEKSHSTKYLEETANYGIVGAQCQWVDKT